MENSDSSELKAAIDKYYPLLVEVRRRVLVVVIVFIITTITGFFFYENIIRFLIDVLALRGINIVFTSPFQFINLAISCGIATGIVLSFPLLIYQLLSFLRPALRQREYQMIVRFLPFSLILFVAGFLFGSFIMKWQIEIFLAKSISIGIGNVLDISKLLTTVVITSALMGVSFQFPVVIFILIRIGILKPAKLSRFRIWVYLGSFLFAILLPADSILADVLLALPLIILFELTLILNRLFSRKLKTP